MPQWIHDRAERLMDKNPEMSQSQAFAIATQQSHAVGKTPKGYGTAEGRKKAKRKYRTPEDDQKTASSTQVSLFLQPDRLIRSEKLAGVPSMLSEDPNKWVPEITSEIFRVFPFLSEYDIRPEVIRADSDTGVGTGRIIIRQPAIRPGMAMPDGPTLIIPFVIRGLELAPLDIATDGKTYFPASQKRMERVLLNPAMTSIGPRAEELVNDTSYFTDLIPPGRSFHGAYPGMSQVKVGGSMLDQLLYICQNVEGADQVEHLQEKLSEATTAAILFAVVPDTLQKIAGFQLRLEEPFQAESMSVALPPTTVQFEKVSSHRIRVTHSNRNAFQKVAQDMPASQAEQYIPEEGQEMMQQEGFYTMPAEPPVHIPNIPSLNPTDPIAFTGEYTVFQSGGKKLNGWATPNVLDLDGNPRNMVVFSNGSVCALQPQIAGIAIGSGLLPPTTHTPEGVGFFLTRNDGDIQAYGPIAIQSAGSMPDGSVVYSCVDAMTGVPLIVQPTPEIVRIAPMGEGMYGIPQKIEFLPCNAPADLLMPSQILKTAAADPATQIQLSNAGADCYNVEGVPVQDLDFSEKYNLTKQAAHYLLVSCGVGPKEALGLIKQAKAQLGAPVPIDGVRPVTSSGAVFDAARNQVYHINEKLASVDPWDLVKEAAHVAHYLYNPERPDGPVHVAQKFEECFKLAAPNLPHQETVNSILSLGLVNPQTVSTFVRQKPDLEKSLSTLCSLLLFARLGAPGVPELALERTIEGFDQTLEALDMLPFNVQE